MSVSEKLRTVFGKMPVRCRRCSVRFESAIWKPSMARYAKCPRCYRTELSRWDVEKYAVPTSVQLKLNLGASPYRCEHCRCNFASFKPCHERFSWRKLREQALKPVPRKAAAVAVEDEESVDDSFTTEPESVS